MTTATRKGASLLGIAAAIVLVPLALREVTLIRCGLDAEALAAAGLTTNEVTSVIGSTSGAVAAAPGALGGPDAAVTSARAEADVLARKVASGLASQEEVSALANAKTALADAEAARAAVLDDLFEAATAALVAEKTATLAMIRAQQLPVEFLVKSREHTEWHALRKALSNERICAKIGDEPDQAMQAKLATWRSDELCAAAKSALDANGDAVKAAWDSAASG